QSPENHPFAVDLDIVGQRSVHQLLDTAVSSSGSARLLAWLLTTVPDLAETMRRRTLIQELIPLGAFRDRLALSAEIVAGQNKGRWNSDGLVYWLNDDDTDIDPKRLRANLVIVAGLALCNIVLFGLYSFGVIPAYWMITFAVYALLSGLQWRKLGGLFDQALSIQAQLMRLAAIFRHLEAYEYSQQPQLKQLCVPLKQAESQPSRLLRRTSWIAAAASLQRNPVLWITLNFIMPWDIFFAYQLERNKTQLRLTVPVWLDVLYELDALNSLANFADLNPDAVFPTFEQDVVFKAQAIGHPLIAHSARIKNDFQMEELGQAIILTGSNMSGKSSFLRTLGVNLQLAYAGGVVCADVLNTGVFRVFTSIRVSDSLADGFSYFYAEVRRLKMLLDAVREEDAPPLFYLIDEIFRGTNNRERLLGSQAYIRALVGAHGVGIIATHDLELVTLAEESSLISNYHFREDVIDGKIVFDYHLRVGPCPTTNALKIMALEGLPVDDDMV
ncbi:MAG: MutS family DNA mismatch repair protein, partial [Aggregatilineales bacterium]